MADAILQAAKVHLDEETGEMVTKNELAKRQKKRAKKTAQTKLKETLPIKEARPKAAKVAEDVKSEPANVFAQGFLAEVYEEIYQIKVDQFRLSKLLQLIKAGDFKVDTLTDSKLKEMLQKSTAGEIKADEHTDSRVQVLLKRLRAKINPSPKDPKDLPKYQEYLEDLEEHEKPLKIEDFSDDNYNDIFLELMAGKLKVELSDDLRKAVLKKFEAGGLKSDEFTDDYHKDVFKKKCPVITRFPPEPNGFLHIGHAKAIAINFGFAEYHGGKCILRFDDTNPGAEKEVYFTAIEEMVSWLGFTPDKITYSSDNFEVLYEKAEELINLGKAYFCKCSKTDMQKQRGQEVATESGEATTTEDQKPDAPKVESKKVKSLPRYRCVHAEQSLEVNLKEFRAMRDGEYKEQDAILRMKQDIEDGNPQMWDLAAYRIITKTKHHKTDDKWKIYPTYDYTHCICDSLENITHSLCTTEFTQSRHSYNWLNKTLDIDGPMQREYGRLDVAGTVLSKRKIADLVAKGYVRGWDDPRLFTLIGVKRRGIPPGAILQFVRELGVTNAPSSIEAVRFEQTVRNYLELTVPRLFLVIDPIRVVIEDAEDAIIPNAPFSSKVAAMGTHSMRFTKTVYIEREDFQEVGSKDFFRLTPEQSVGLQGVLFPIKVVSFQKDASTGKITEVKAAFDKDLKKAKVYIQWVAEGSKTVEVREYNQLFKNVDPEKPDYLTEINPDSEKIWPSALIEDGIEEIKSRAPWPEAAGESKLGMGGPESIRFQAMRYAYMAVDSDSTVEKMVLNRIVGLKSDHGKK